MREANRPMHLMRHTGCQPRGIAAAGFGNSDIKGGVGVVAPGSKRRDARRRHVARQRCQHVLYDLVLP